MAECADHPDASPDEMTLKLRELFQEEAYALAGELEHAVLQVEKDPTDREQIDRIFRALHTLKGSGGASGMRDIAALAHEVETFYDLVRKDKIALSRGAIDLTLAARDQITAMLDEYYQGAIAGTGQETTSVVAAFRKIIAGNKPKKEAAQKVDAASAASVTPAVKIRAYRIVISESYERGTRGDDANDLLDRLRKIGTCAMVADMDARSSPSGAPGLEVLLTTENGMDAIRNALARPNKANDFKIEVLDKDELSPNDGAGTGLLPVEPSRAARPTSVDPGPSPTQPIRHAAHNEPHASIRVSTDKLDVLADLVGELVTIQTRFGQAARLQGTPAFLSLSEDLDRLTCSLREEAMSIRMLQIGETFGRFRRVVRDVAQELNKSVKLVTEGDDTELDKTILEKLTDPLIHLIRNSIDHGIEAPARRASLGKPADGTIVLSAMHAGPQVLIRITDDGAGFDLEAIREKGRERGLIREGQACSEQDLLSLIFLPGFSTSETVTNISGRGVGMDVVKRAVESLGGSIRVHNNAGAGSSIELQMPLTLAIIDGFLVSVGGERYVFPLSLVEECVERRLGVMKADNRRLLDVRGEMVPIIFLREQLRINDTPPDIAQIVITRVSDRRVGFVVDHVLGDHQTVIKNLGRIYRDAKGVSGATILGDGSVALVLDVPKLVSLACEEEHAITGTAASADGGFALRL